MANEVLRREMRTKNMKLWQLADALGVSEPTVTRMLRHELAKDQAEKVKAAVEAFREVTR